jgi:hypothetical protein
LSGLVVSRALTLLHWIGIVCGGVFLILSIFHAYYSAGSPQAAAPRNVLVFGMVVVTLVSQIVVSGKMAALKAAMGEIDNVAVTDPRRIAFNQLHQWSTGLEVLVLLLGLAALYVVARQWAMPVLNAVQQRRAAGLV